MINSLSKLIYKMEKDIIYKLIKYCNLELCIDVGAAKGTYTNIISSASSNKAKIFAYEPFYGNHKYFYKETCNLKNILLIKKALSNQPEKGNLFVQSKVRGEEKGWKNFKGYSSLGMLSQKFNIDKLKYPFGEHLDVDCTTLDLDFNNKHINFVKIDVQGSELKVIQGSKNLLKNQLIDMLYIEWSGEIEILEYLDDNYIIYDTTYLIIPEDYKKLNLNDLEVIEELNLSTGKVAYEVLPKDKEILPINIIKYLKNENIACIQTDLIAVSKNYHNKFLNIINNYNLNENKKG